ncbi:hypothetical protein AALC25_17215 [Lachnospiraceae bacterium 29-84]
MGIREAAAKVGEESRRKLDYERELINGIAGASSLGFAGRAVSELDPKKHLYSFYGYLSLLQALEKMLLRGINPDDALDIVQDGFDAEGYMGALEADAQTGEIRVNQDKSEEIRVNQDKSEEIKIRVPD